jgi:hypothetical protein
MKKSQFLTNHRADAERETDVSGLPHGRAERTGGRARKWLASIAALAAALGVGLALSSCNAAEAKNRAAAELLDEIFALSKQAETGDFDNEEWLDSYVAESKALYQKLRDKKLDAAYSDAEGKLRDGCDKMLEYLDQIKSYKAMEAESDEARAERTRLSGLHTAAFTSIVEARAAITPETEQGE